VIDRRRITTLRSWSLAIMTSCAWTFGAMAAHANQSPIGCNLNGVTIHIQRSPASVMVGGVVSYNFSIGNLDDSIDGLVAW
jgi:hypothetical protein